MPTSPEPRLPRTGLGLIVTDRLDVDHCPVMPTIREAGWNKADFPCSCARFGNLVKLPQADQEAFSPRKGLNLPAALSSVTFFLSARGRPTKLKEGVA